MAAAIVFAGLIAVLGLYLWLRERALHDPKTFTENDE